MRFYLPPFAGGRHVTTALREQEVGAHSGFIAI